MADYTERRWTSRDGLNLYARDYAGVGGEARLPIICLHGLTRNSKDFADVAPWMAGTGRRVLVPDVRGRGLSGRDPDPSHYTPKVYARDVLGLLRSLGLARAVFLGTSMGGIITMTMMSMRPNVVAAAILNDVGPEVAPEGIARIMSYVGQNAEVRDWTEAADYVRRTNGAAFPDYGPAEWDRLARNIFRDNAGVPELDYDARILLPLLRLKPGAHRRLAWFLFRWLARTRPTLLVRGAQSDVITPAIADKMARKAPGLRRVDVPGVGHAPMLTEYAAVEAIDQFLNMVG
ncbi:MAG: alpha/beta hydrolase [Sphingomicrobium sp.]